MGFILGTAATVAIFACTPEGRDAIYALAKRVIGWFTKG